MNKISIVETISDLALRSSVERADEAIMKYADEGGDEQAISLLENLEPAVLAKIIDGFDIGKPSFLALVSSPEQAIRIIRADPRNWRAYIEGDQDYLDELIPSMANVLRTIVIGHENDGKWLHNFFEIVQEDETVILYMSLPFAYFCEGKISNPADAILGSEDESAIDPDDREDDNSFEIKDDRVEFPYPFNQSGEIGHIYYLMEEHHPVLAKKFLRIILGEDKDFSFRDVLEVVLALRSEGEGEKEADMFLPLT